MEKVDKTAYDPMSTMPPPVAEVPIKVEMLTLLIFRKVVAPHLKSINRCF